MLYAGLDLSRNKVDVHVLDETGATVHVGSVSPDRNGLSRLASGLQRQYGQPVYAAIESMKGARFVHDELEQAGWEVDLADAQRAKGLAPLTCKTDRIDAWVLAELARRRLVPSIWLPTPAVRSERERARRRLHLVRHRASLKNRIHAILTTFGHPVPVSDLFGARGRDLLEALQLPEPWAGTVLASLRLIDEIDVEIEDITEELKQLGADHPYVRRLITVPGISWVLAYTIASQIGDISRFASAKKLCSYSGLCPRVFQSGGRDRRGVLSKNGPRYLRWALIEATIHAARHPAYKDHYERTKTRLGKQRGATVARIEIARKLAKAIWYMLLRDQAFSPVDPATRLAA